MTDGGDQFRAGLGCMPNDRFAPNIGHPRFSDRLYKHTPITVSCYDRNWLQNWLQAFMGRNVKPRYSCFAASDHFENPARTSNKGIVGENFCPGKKLLCDQLCWVQHELQAIPLAFQSTGNPSTG
jgi:hypothetical protein